MAKTLVYLNNFPREGGVKGQEFKGDDKLKEELLKRGIIAEGEVEVPTKGNMDSATEVIKRLNTELELSATKIAELEANAELSATKIAELEAKVPKK